MDAVQASAESAKLSGITIVDAYRLSFATSDDKTAALGR